MLCEVCKVLLQSLPTMYKATRTSETDTPDRSRGRKGQEQEGGIQRSKWGRKAEWDSGGLIFTRFQHKLQEMSKGLRQSKRFQLIELLNSYGGQSVKLPSVFSQLPSSHRHSSLNSPRCPRKNY